MRLFIQALSLLFAIATLALLLRSRKLMRSWSLVVPLVVYTSHIVLFYGYIIMVKIGTLPRFIDSSDWSAVLRLHGVTAFFMFSFDLWKELRGHGWEPK